MRALIFTLGMLLTLSTAAQLEKADEAFQAHHYPEAIRMYEHYLKRHEAPGAALNLAIAYWKTGDEARAETWFSRAISERETPEAHRWYAQLLMANGKYERASESLLKFAVTTQDQNAAAAASSMADFCMQLAGGNLPPSECAVLDIPFNSKFMDFSPALIGDTLVFVSNRPGSVTKEGQRDPWTQSRFTDLFGAVPDTLGNAKDVFPFAPAIATHLHEGPLAYHAGREELLVTVSVPNKGKAHTGHTSKLKIVQFHRTSSGGWSPPKDFGFHNTDFNMVHPALTPAGDRMVFSANYEGGFGGMDLWYSERTPDGEWIDPVNLGPEINTPGEEVFPVIQKDGTLYFSSDFRLGQGGLDIYRARRFQDGWVKPVNAGYPLNGASDDFGLILLPGGQRGYFSSDRNDGTDNLFMVRFEQTIRVEGLLVNAETGEPLPKARIEVSDTNSYTEVLYTDADGMFESRLPMEGTYQLRALHPQFEPALDAASTWQINAAEMTPGSVETITLALQPKSDEPVADAMICGTVINADGQPIPSAYVRIENRETGAIYETATDAEGAFFQPALSENEYVIQAAGEGFGPVNMRVTCSADEECHAVAITLAPHTTVQSLMQQPELIETGLQLELYHVYFDRGRAELRTEDLAELEKLKELLDEYPSMEGQIQAHTDARHTDAFNLELSQRRADAARNWLIENGIAAERITAKGYGELYLMNRCTDGVSCGELEHERNRRVEFRVIAFDRDREIRSREKPEYKASTANR